MFSTLEEKNLTAKYAALQRLQLRIDVALYFSIASLGFEK